MCTYLKNENDIIVHARTEPDGTSNQLVYEFFMIFKSQQYPPAIPGALCPESTELNILLMIDVQESVSIFLSSYCESLNSCITNDNM